MDPAVLPWLQPVGTSQWHARHMCGGNGGLYLKSAWFLHNKIFASLTPRSLLVIPFPRSVEVVQHRADHILPKNFSASPFSPRRVPNFFLDQRFGTKGCRSVHKSLLSIRDFQAICLAGKSAQICTSSQEPLGQPQGNGSLKGQLGTVQHFVLPVGFFTFTSNLKQSLAASSIFLVSDGWGAWG